MITELTEQQIARFSEYVDMGIKIGLATCDGNIDEEKIRTLTDTHRQKCGVAKATNFQIYDSPFSAIKNIKGINCSNALFGNHDIYWLAYYLYMQVELGVTGLDSIKELLELSKRVGWMWMSSDTTIITKRPKELHMKDSITELAFGKKLKVLHNDMGMAIKYWDGEGVYALNGTRLSKKVGKKFIDGVKASDIDVGEVLKIKNTEERTEILKKVGIERAFDKLNKKKLHAHVCEKGGEYELFRVEMGNSTRIYLAGKCPSNDEPFFEAVHPDCTTVLEALNWRVEGVVRTNYIPPLELT